MSDGSRTTEARSLEELETLRAVWDQAHFLRLDPELDYFATVVRNLPSAEPYVVASTAECVLQSLLVGRLEETRLDTRFGYRIVYAPRRRVMTIAHGGLFAADAADLTAVLDRVKQSMRSGLVDALVAPAVPINGRFHAALTGLGKGFRADRYAIRRSHRSLELPTSWEAFLEARSKSVRAGARYTRRRVEATFVDKLRVERYDGRSNVDRLLADLESIAKLTYQRGLDAGFATTTLQRSLIELGAARGWFRAYLLYIDDVPSAFWQGWVHRRTYISSSTGYRPELAEHRLGIYLLGRVIEDLCNDVDVDRLDFGFGDADYKRQYATDSFDEQDVLIFAPTFRGARTAFVREAWSRANLLATNVAAASGADRWLKRSWRRWLRRTR